MIIDLKDDRAAIIKKLRQFKPFSEGNWDDEDIEESWKVLVAGLNVPHKENYYKALKMGAKMIGEHPGYFTMGFTWELESGEMLDMVCWLETNRYVAFEIRRVADTDMFGEFIYFSTKRLASKAPITEQEIIDAMQKSKEDWSP